MPAIADRLRAMAEIQIQNRPARVVLDSRWPVLAGLRFVLALVVVAGHLNWFVLPIKPWIFLESFGGTAAVLGFLIISGYSIGHSLERRPIGFYRRRVLRIYPMYVAAVLFALVPFYSGADALRAPGDTFARPHFWVVIGNLLMLQNIACRPVDSNMLVWTLGIEVACYLLAPQFRKMPTGILIILICVSASVYGIYPRLGLRHYATVLYGIPLLTFAWAWIAGFVLHRYRNSPGIGLGIIGLGMVLSTLNTTYNTRFSTATVAASALLVTFSPRLRLPTAIGKITSYLGDLSYPLYLFHLPAFLLGYAIMNINNAWSLILLALLISAAFLFIESTLRPVLFRSRSRDFVPTAN
jgi:peptidoglycan/LPS O-acetylase OafA/YrhL